MAISKQLFANNAKTTLLVSIAPADTIVQVASATLFPVITTGQYFMITLDNGSTIEVLKVTSVSGNSFTCVRAQEGTVASSFPSGIKVENRLTAGTITNFLPSDTRFSEINSLDNLTSPVTSNGNSYITHSVDDSGTPIMAIRNNDSLWRLPTHPRMAFTSSIGTGGTTSIISSTTVTNVGTISSGRYVIQFTTGGNTGACRLITSLSVATISWTTALPVAAAPGDQFEIYRSTSSIISDLESQSSSGIIYSILLGE